MDDVAVERPAPRADRRLPRPLGWALCGALGLALGELCRVPLWWSYLTVRVVAQEAGWAYVDATFDEGVGLWLTSTVVLWSVFALVAGALSVLAQLLTRIPARQWWWTTAVLWLVPFAVLDLPDLP